MFSECIGLAKSARQNLFLLEEPTLDHDRSQAAIPFRYRYRAATTLVPLPV
jgi:hypothetical protein